MANEQVVRANSTVLPGVSTTRVQLKYMGTNGLSGTTVSFVRGPKGCELEAISPIRPVPEEILKIIALEAMDGERIRFQQAAE